MLVIIGVIGVTVCWIGGYMMAGGKPIALVQPAEFVIICGVAGFQLIIANPFNVVKSLIPATIKALKGSGINKSSYLELLGLLASIFDTMRKEGVLGIEGDLSNPEESPRFKKFPRVTENHELMETLCGALRLFVDGVVNAFDLERLLDTELETHHEEALIAPDAVTKTADALPGIGIVAAVLGIIVTMQYIDGPPAYIGQKVAAALVGTMLGVLLCYGYVGPLATKIGHGVREEGAILKTVQAGLVSFAGGAPPQVALEFARKTIPPELRPTSEELDEIVKEAKKG